MNAILRLVWKEYRALRSFWLALAVFGLACDASIFAFVGQPQERLPGLLAFAGVLPAGFALGAGAILFALEREEATRDFLRYLPVTSPRLFTSKVTTAMLGTLLLGLLLAAVTLSDVRKVLTGRTVAADMFTGAADAAVVYVVMVVQAMGWSVFFSLRSARPLLAALLGALGAVSCIGLTHFSAERLGFDRPQWSWTLPVLHLTAAAAIWSANVWLGSRWLHGRRVIEREPWADVGRFSAYRRLVWQEWRSSWRMLTAIVILGLLVPLLLWLAFIPTTVLGLALLGGCSFLADQEGRQFRFFAERGVAPRQIWIARELFWGGAAVALALLLFAEYWLALLVVGLADPEARRLFDALGWVFQPGGYLVWVGLAFAAGQLCSMFFRSGVLAATLSVVLAGVLAAWAALMHKLQVPLWWSAAPLIGAMLAATWLRSTGWVLQRNSVRAWLPAVAVLALPVAALLAGVPAYRVWEIPQPTLALEMARSAPPSEAAKAAVTQFLAACQSLTLPKSVEPSPWNNPYDATPTAEEQTWLTENAPALDRVIEAVDRLSDDAAVAVSPPTSPVEWRILAVMLVRYGQTAEADGKLVDAWWRYQAVFKLARFVRRENGVPGEILGDELQQSAAVQLIRWGAHEGQTTEKLRAAIDSLGRSEAQLPPLAEVALIDYQEALAMLEDVRTHPEQFGGDAVLAARWTPWEYTRVRRLLAYMASLNVSDARYAEAALSDTSAKVPFLPRAGEFAEVRRLWQTTTFSPLTETALYAENRRQLVCCLRAVQLVLAAQAWRLDYDALPEKLGDLARPFFEKLPVDPYDNQPFDWLPWGLRIAVRSRNAGEIPAGTPLIYGRGSTAEFVDQRERTRMTLERLRRRSADDRIVRDTPSLAAGGVASAAESTQGGMAAMPAVRAGGGPMGPDTSAASEQGASEVGMMAGAAPVAPDAPQYVEQLDGLAFPIP
ncbi:MAG TPA: hypothetical protein VFI31_02840 [Pirellulales bacterium]|nr:hypothetical protein [Pirellulales bacterium]